jgi:predicted RNase H-like HicB family nuclease
MENQEQMERVYEVVLIPQNEGGFVVSVPDLPSVATEGETVEEALDMAKDAITGYLATMREEGWQLPAVQHKRVTVEA